MGEFQNTGQPDWDWWGRLWPTPGETLRSLGMSEGEAVVEVGSGNGYFALPAGRIAEPAPVYAVELDHELLDDCVGTAEMCGIENLVPVHADAVSLSEHVPEKVETAVLANVLHGVEDKVGLVREIHDVLLSEGSLVVISWRDVPMDETTLGGEKRGPPTELRMSPVETEEVVVEAGFEVVRSVELPPYHYAVVFAPV
ncbi:MAG: class I SAM-dependent methyltransferase [Halobacteriales archaeon]|nr:class I SAM-dependent methyltransferase [Halobacteriales archaeon]